MTNADDCIEDISQTDDAVPEDADAEGEHTQFKIRRKLPGRRIDKYLQSRFPRVSRTTMQRLIKEGAVTVNGMPTKASYEPTPGDVVDVYTPTPVPVRLIPEDIPLDILYEDDHLIAINKRTGIICHPARSTQTGTIANALAFYSEKLSAGGHPFRPGIVHRLDKNTTGVMLVAKTDECHWRLGLQFERRTIDKTYFGIVEGEPRLDADIIDMPIGAHPTVKDRFIVTGMSVRPILFKDAVTRYEVAERFKGFAVVHMHPKTGRTHQLRVHMSAIGHPMMGDTVYGGHLFTARQIAGGATAPDNRYEEGATNLPKAEDPPLIPYQSLHALRIQFVHPIREETMTIEAPLPEQLQDIVDLLRRYRSY